VRGPDEKAVRAIAEAAAAAAMKNAPPSLTSADVKKMIDAAAAARPAAPSAAAQDDGEAAPRSSRQSAREKPGNGPRKRKTAEPVPAGLFLLNGETRKTSSHEPSTAGVAISGPPLQRWTSPGVRIADCGPRCLPRTALHHPCYQSQAPPARAPFAT
jgi:hypothetical protein